LSQADAERDPTLRMQLYAEAQRLLTADCPVAYA
jgi:ABC-type oligopeptide transport system substrate-binding subunit